MSIKSFLRHYSDVPWYKKIYYRVDEFLDDYPRHWYYTLKRVVKNYIHFLPTITTMTNWDYYFTIELLTKSLEYLAAGLQSSDDKKRYRRCLTAAGKLRKAYADEAYTDKSYRYLITKNPMRFEKLPGTTGYSVMTHDYKNTPDYYEKMSRVILKRLKESEDRAKKEAWGYIHKYIATFWS